MKDYFLKPAGGDRTAYLEYLLDRLTEFRKAGRSFGQKHGGNLNVHITRAGIQRQLGWPLADEAHFAETCAHIQAKIENTILGRTNAAKGRRSYHAFTEHGEPNHLTGASRVSGVERTTEQHSGTSAISASSCSKEFGGETHPAVSSREGSGPPTGCDPGMYPVPSNLPSSPARGNAGSGDFSQLSTHDPQPDLPQTAPAMLPEENSGTGGDDDHPHETPAPPAALSTLNPQPSTEKALTLGAWRARTLKAARPLLAAKVPQSTVATAVGTSAPTLCRLLQDYGHLSDADLTSENCAGDFTNSGRRSRWEKFAVQPAIVRRLQELYLLSCGSSTDQSSKGRRTGSAAATLDVFALDPLCPPDLAALLQRGQQPKPLIQAIRAINDLHEQKYRGAKHSSLNGTLIQRRTLTEILTDGSSVDIQLGDWWVFDDMSDNLPHWWEGPEQIPFIGRQGLYCYDLMRHWVGVEKIGTVRDSYTAAIILRFLRQLMQTFGKPRRGIVFERSVWMANTIRGVRLLSSRDASSRIIDEEIERAAMAAEDKTMLEQGIRALGIELHYTYTPRGKEIEGAFNYLQRLKPMLASTLNPQRSTTPVHLGRHAGEFEHAAKQVRRVRAGSHTPAELGFLHIEESLALDLKVMGLINARQARKTQLSTPYPQLAPLSARDLAVFLPEKRDLEIRNGKLTATVDGQPHDFCAPELFASLGSGFRLTLAFDPSEPTLGCALYNREGSSANFRGWQTGEFIGWADYLAPVARFDWRSGEGIEDPQADAKRRFNKHIRTAFGAVGLNRRVSTARDGRGNLATVTNSTEGSRGSKEDQKRGVLTSALSCSIPARVRARVTAAIGETEENFNRQAERLAREEARARQRETKPLALDD